MTLSSDQFASRGLDAMLIVYSVLDDHPASVVCESFIRTTNKSPKISGPKPVVEATYPNR